jgi:hypothetical protein
VGGWASGNWRTTCSCSSTGHSPEPLGVDEAVWVEDDVMGRVTAVVQGGQAGDRAAARRELAGIWAEVEEGGGDAFHRCVIAHFLADLQDDLQDELVWDERALAAVAGVTDERAQEYHPSLQVRGFLPSLYLSLADDHRRLGDAARAHEFLELARGTIDALGDDAYGGLVRSGLDNVARALAEGSTERLLSH